MKKTWLLINHNLLALLLAGLLLSCTNLPRPKPEFSPRPPACWLLQPVTYRLRHSAQLEYRGKKEMLEGFMELDLKEDRAHLIIFTSFGLTLLNLEIRPDDYQLSRNAAAEAKENPGMREQRFAGMVAAAVQHVFFSLEERGKENRRKSLSISRKVLAEFRGKPLELAVLSDKQNRPAWVVTYQNYQPFAAGRLPECITLTSNRPKFTLTLWLHKAEIMADLSKPYLSRPDLSR